VSAGPTLLPYKLIVQQILRYERGGGSVPPPDEEGRTETTGALPVGSRKNRANVTRHCAEEV